MAEDRLLRESIAVLGLRWSLVARNVTGRTQRQCRSRWVSLMSASQKKDRPGEYQ